MHQFSIDCKIEMTNNCHSCVKLCQYATFKIAMYTSSATLGASTTDYATGKEITNTSRKYAVPLLEFLDKQKITYRIGNERKICK